MYFTRSTLLGICFFWIFAVAAQAQIQQASASFSVDVISVRSDEGLDNSRLDVYAAIPYASLSFLKVGDVFEARYEITASVFEVSEGNKAESLVQEATWRDGVTVRQFNATQSVQSVARSTQALNLNPGQYRLQIRLLDLESNQTYESDLKAEVRDFAGAVRLSDLILVSDFDAASQTISPIVSDRIGTSDPSFKFFYEVYSQGTNEVRVTSQMIRTSHSRGLPFLRWLFRSWQSDSSGEISYMVDEVRLLRDGRHPVVVTIPVADYEAGEYLVRVLVEDLNGNVVDHAERFVTMEWSDEAEYQGQDIDQVIAQLSYIAKPRELREIREGKTKQERRERFLAFWQKRDPTPSTPENERMEEYYFRIDYANRHYTDQSNGWETDRGHTVILYGEPDEVVSNAADVSFDQPYEVWHYHRIGRRFIFVDRAGTGQFELLELSRSAIR